MWTPSRVLRVCGAAMCAVTAGFSITELLQTPPADRTAGCLLEAAGRGAGLSTAGIAVLETAAVLLFAVLFWEATRPEFLGRQRSNALLRIGLQAGIGILIGPELLGLVSLLTPLNLRRDLAKRTAVVIVALQTGAYVLQMTVTGSHPLAKLMPGAGLGLTMLMMITTAVVWHGLAFSLGLFAVGERQRAQELARVNGELAATRQLEAETARIAVRLGISRDLHDASGHHLAALNVNLRLLRRLQNDPELTRDKIEECLFVVGQLLQEVRSVVKDLRSLQRIDLQAILETMCRGFEGITVHLDSDPALCQAEPYHAHTIFRCVQEILTNVAKHSEARNVWLVLRLTGQGYRIEGRDDGRGVSDFHCGNGLTGMRERVLEFGGDFEVQSRAGEGFTVRLNIPVRGAVA